MKWALLLASVLYLASLNGAFAVCYDQNEKGEQRRLVLSGDEAFDTKTGLTWKRCSLGTAQAGRRGCRGEKMFADLDTATQLAKLMGEGWRVPSGPELESIID
jgi:hypothetical protein